MMQAGIMPAPDLSGIQKTEIQIPVRDGSSIKALAYRSESSVQSNELAPVYVYFHGGGWTFGLAEAVEGAVKDLVEKLGLAVVSVDYRLGPEFKFPTAAHDAIDTVKWVSGLIQRYNSS
jgi:acetyl esterase/lipase